MARIKITIETDDGSKETEHLDMETTKRSGAVSAGIGVVGFAFLGPVGALLGDRPDYVTKIKENGEVFKGEGDSPRESRERALQKREDFLKNKA